MFNPLLPSVLNSRHQNLIKVNRKGLNIEGKGKKHHGKHKQAILYMQYIYHEKKIVSLC